MQTINAQENVLPVGELIISNEQATPQAAVNKVAERFFSTTDLDAIAVVEGKEPIGLVTRTKLLFTLFRRFGFELYGKYPIIAIADTTPLIVPENERLDVVIDKALERQPQDIYDEIIVTTPGGAYKGLLSVKQLVIQQSNSLASNILQKEMASARAKELEKINQVKSQFLANVTHELRSPVNAIIGLAELLRMSAEKGSIEQIKERLSFMISSATNLRAIITNILDLSKLEAGKMEVTVQEVNATSLICGNRRNDAHPGGEKAGCSKGGGAAPCDHDCNGPHQASTDHYEPGEQCRKVHGAGGSHPVALHHRKQAGDSCRRHGHRHQRTGH